MTWDQVTVVGGATLAAVVAVALVLRVIPELHRSTYRYALWRIRDEIVDDVLDERLPRCSAVFDLVHRYEADIRFAEHLTVMKAFVDYKMVRPSLPLYAPLDRSDLSTQQRDLLRSYEERATEASIEYLFTGSLCGWLVYGVFYTMGYRRGHLSEFDAKMAARTKRAINSSAKSFVREPGRWAPNGVRDDRPMSTFA